MNPTNALFLFFCALTYAPFFIAFLVEDWIMARYGTQWLLELGEGL